MSANSSNELLEPQLSAERSREKLVRDLLVSKPEIFRVSGPGVLDQVKTFLPQMAEAEKKLTQAVARDGGEKYNVENVRDDQSVVEMDIAVMNDDKEDRDAWSSDSDADSTPSPSENSYTSDTDISSSSTCSSSSCDETPKSQNNGKKRPLIQDISNGSSREKQISPPSKNPRQS